MKILYTHYHTDPCHPAVQMVEHISKEMRGFGHDVRVHATAGLLASRSATQSPGAAASSRCAVAAAGILSKLKGKVWFAKAMARNRRWRRADTDAIAQFQPDVVLTRQDAYCWSAVRAATQAGVPVVTYADAPVAYESRVFNAEGRWHPPQLLETIERWGLSHSKAIITVSNPAAERLSTYGLTTPIHVNHNGIDPSRFPEFAEREKQAIKQSLGLGDKLVLGFQGTFKAFHGIARLKELMLWSAPLDVAWLMIGDGPERRSVEDAVRGKVDAVFLGRRAPGEMGRLLAAIDIAVAPHSQLTGDFYFCPLKILEYAAAGCAVVASEQGDIPLLLAKGKGGQIVRDDRHESWTTAVHELIRDPRLRAELGQRARAHALNNLTWRDTARRVEDTLCDVLGTPRHGSVAGQVGRYRQPLEAV